MTEELKQEQIKAFEGILSGFIEWRCRDHYDYDQAVKAFTEYLDTMVACIEVMDHNCHRFVIPESKEAEFDSWLAKEGYDDCKYDEGSFRQVYLFEKPRA